MKRNVTLKSMFSNSNNGESMKFVIKDLKRHEPKMSSLATHLHKAELFAEGRDEEQEHANALLGVSVEMIDFHEKEEDRARRNKSYDKRRAYVESFFKNNKSIKLPAGMDFKNPEHVEILSLYVQSMKEDKMSVGHNYTSNAMVKVILQKRASSGNWYNHKPGFWNDEKGEFEATGPVYSFYFDIEDLFVMEFNRPVDLKFQQVETDVFNMESGKTEKAADAFPCLFALLVEEGFYIDGESMRAVLISDKLITLTGEIAHDDQWSEAWEMYAGITLLPPKKAMDLARMEEQDSEYNIPVGATGISSKSADILTLEEEHKRQLAEQKEFEDLENKAKVKLDAKGIAVENKLNDNAEITCLVEALIHTSKTKGSLAGIAMVHANKDKAKLMWDVFWAYKAQTGEELPGVVFNALKTAKTNAVDAAKQKAFVEKATDEACGLIIRINKGELLSLSDEQVIAVYDATQAGARIKSDYKEYYLALKAKAVYLKGQVA